jgi:hypothetical protein
MILPVLHPDDFDGHKILKRAMPHVKWTTGEHEYSRYGFRKLIEDRSVDILQVCLSLSTAQARCADVSISRTSCGSVA